MEEAHRRHQADPLALAAGRLELGAELGLGGHGLHALGSFGRVRSGPLGERLVHRDQLRRGLGEGREVAARPSRSRRARSGRSGRRRPARPSSLRVASTSGASSSRPSSIPADSSSPDADSWSATRKLEAMLGGGVVGGALLLGHGERAHAEREREGLGEAPRPPRWSRRSRRGCRRRRWPGRGRSGGGGARTRPTRRAVALVERVQRGGAAGVADQGGRAAPPPRPRRRPRGWRRRGRRAGRPWRRRPRAAASALAARRTGIPAASAADARLEPTRPRPTIAIGARSVGVGIRSRSSSRIGDTRRLR